MADNDFQVTFEDITESASVSFDNNINDGVLTIQKNGNTIATFTANDNDNVTANITMPVIYVQSSEPTSAVNGDIWIDASGE